LRASIRSGKSADMNSSIAINYFVLSEQFGWTIEEIDNQDLEMLNKYKIIIDEKSEMDQLEDRKMRNRQALR